MRVRKKTQVSNKGRKKESKRIILREEDGVREKKKTSCWSEREPITRPVAARKGAHSPG